MSTNPIVEASDTFDIVVPEPGQPLRALVIHPDNQRLQERGKEYLSLKLPPRKVKVMEADLKKLTIRLDKVGYTAIVERFESAATRWRSIIERRKEILELKDTVGAEERRELAVEWEALRSELLTLKEQSEGLVVRRRQYAPLAQKAATIEQRLREHYAAVDREKAYQKARIKLADESYDWHDIIIECLTGLGYCYRYHKNGKEYTRRVRIKKIWAGMDSVYLKIDATNKGWFGWRWSLPRNVRPTDLVIEETLAALSVATERQVEGSINKQSGVVYRINRLGVMDGIIERVTYPQIMSTYGQARHEGIPIPIGVRQGLEVCWLQLADNPHFLIAGASGSGKSNLIKVFINTIISKQDPSDVRLALVDLKEGTEFAIYADHGIPHLLGDCVTSPPAFLEMLTRLEMLRAERSEQLRSVYATSIDEYNAKVPAAQKMARVMVIIDEFSAIYMSSPFQDEKENKRVADRIKLLIRQLLAKARAAGIHLIICTQSPYAEILPGIDKANISVKIVGRFLDKVVSRTILGVGAAADIPEKALGRMIVQTSGQMFLIQTPLVSPEDRIEAINASQLWTEVSEIELPALPANAATKALTESEVIAIGLKYFGGKLSVRRMWDEHIGETGRISRSSLEALVKGIGREETITHDGIEYAVVSTGKGVSLKIPAQPSPILQEIAG
jgi:energy-coupling factor transporter ATP-binding protein EcfA2